MKIAIQKIITGVLLVLIVIPNITSAYTIEKHPEAPIENRFVVGPAKIETEALPGETKTVMLSVENRMGRSQTFAISFEDFIGSKNPDETVTLLGTAKSSMSLRDFLFVEEKKFTLSHGDRIIIPISISLSGNVSPGGKFGAALVSAVSDSNKISANDRAYTGANIVGQVATLIFVTIPGNVNSQGQLISFETKSQKKFFGTSNIEVRLTYENTGNTNLNPYGGITVTNMFGKVIQKIPLDPWYALPDSVRTRDVLIQNVGMFGKYTATAEVNRGYGDLVDVKSTTYFVLPIGTLALLLILVATLVYVARRIIVRNKVIA